MDPLRTCSKPCYFDLIFHHFGTPFEGPERRLRLGPLRAAFGLEDLLRASQTHARDPKFWNFCHLPIRGQWKCHFDPILSPPRPKFWPPAKMCLFVPFVRMDLGGTLRDPKFDPILTILDLFWGSLEEAAARPRTSCLWAGKPMPGPQIFTNVYQNHHIFSLFSNHSVMRPSIDLGRSAPEPF